MDGEDRRNRRHRRGDADDLQKRFEDPRLQIVADEVALFSRPRFQQDNDHRPRVKGPMEAFLQREAETRQRMRTALLTNREPEPRTRRRVPVPELGIRGGDPASAHPRPGMTAVTLDVTEEMRREMAQAIIDARNSVDEDESLDDRRGGTLVPPMWGLGQTVEEIEAELRTLPDVVHRMGPSREGEHEVPGRSGRAYVPQSHGNGFHYGWEITLGTFWWQLFDEVERKAKDGMRIAYITPSTKFSVEQQHPRFDVIWIRDDDSNFLTHVGFVFTDNGGDAVADLDAIMDGYKGAGLRPLCVVYTGVETAATQFFCIVWIKDARYGADDWVVDTVSHAEHNRRFTELGKEQGFRPIWTTLYFDRLRRQWMLTTIWVRDGHKKRWALRVWGLDRLGDVGTDYDGWDPVGKFSEWAPYAVPICVENKEWFATSDTPPQPVAVVLGTDDDDLRTQTDPGVYWSREFGGVEIGTPQYATSTGYLGKRPYAIAPRPPQQGQPGGPERYVVVRANPPHPMPVRVIDDPVDVPLPQGLSDQIDYLAHVSMVYAPMPALSIAVRDPSGWRFRRAYTHAPWAYDDTYPDSQFRVGSTAKMLTALTLLAMLEENASVDIDSKVFQLTSWPEDLEPTHTGLQHDHPEWVLDVTIANLLVHQGGWDQRKFNAGKRSEDIVPAVGKSGLMWGWQSPAGKGLLPMVRRDKFRYMLRAEAFKQFDAPGTSLDWIYSLTGWRSAFFYVPGDEPGAYSGWHYGILGAVVELLGGAPSTDGRANFEYYAELVDERLLARVGARRTIRARTSRFFCAPGEVIYPTAKYVQQANVAEAKFWTTIMFSPRPSTYVYGDEHDDYYKPDEPWPVDIDVAPLYGSIPYASSHIREATTPGGGWVSTAPDLCRIASSFDASEAVFGPYALSLLLDTSDITGPDYVTKLRRTRGGLIYEDADTVWHGGNSTGEKARVQYYKPRRRRFAVCGNPSENTWGVDLPGKLEALLKGAGQ